MAEVKYLTGAAKMPDGPVYVIGRAFHRRWWQFWRPRILREELKRWQIRDGRWVLA